MLKKKTLPNNNGQIFFVNHSECSSTWYTSKVSIKNRKRDFKKLNEGTLSSFESYNEYNKLCREEIKVIKIQNNYERD